MGRDDGMGRGKVCLCGRRGIDADINIIPRLGLLVVMRCDVM